MKFIQEWGLIAGSAGLTLGVLLVIMTIILRKIKFSTLNQKNTFRVLISIIIFTFLTAILSLSLYEPDSPSQVTVLVHSEKGKDDLVLPSRGKVKLLYGDAIVLETINEKGEATFKQIPPKFFSLKEKTTILFFDPQGEPYRVLNPDSLYQLSKNQYISLTVKLFGLNELRGVVKDFETGDPIPDVRVSIQEISVLTNQYGEYKLSIPEENQQKFQTVRAYKDGYEYFEQKDVPIQTDSECPILMKSKHK